MKKMTHVSCSGLFLTTIIACVCGEFVQPPLSLALRSFAEEETRLPCQFKPQDDEQVVQVTWFREKSGGTKEQIIAGHMTEGLQDSAGFSGRVCFVSGDPIKDSTLLIKSTKESDQATYTCHISTFPLGNFERQITLTVWRIPISSLDPVILSEGQSYRVAATCRAVGLPPPRLSWDTDIPGKSQNKSSEDGVVTSQYYLHPLRGMNGRKLDCLVWHPALEHPRRLSNTLDVHFPPDAVIAGYNQSWTVSRKGVELKCEGGGNPKPHNFTWTRKGGVGLPESISVEGNKLVFTRPLNKTDEGIYECEARNSVGSVKAEVNVRIAASHLEASFNVLLIIVVGAAAGALVAIMALIIILVSCHHRRRTRKLKRELDEKKEEINNLSRHTSIRRLNSFSTDTRMQNEECALIRIDSPMKQSDYSLERDGLREGDYDSLGRPAIYPAYCSERGSVRRETEGDRQERMRRVESFVKHQSSSMELDTDHQRDQSPPPLSVSSGPPRGGGSDKEGWGQREGVPEGEEGECIRDSYAISEAISNHFYYSNGVLRPKPHPNAIILRPHSQII